MVVINFSHPVTTAQVAQAEVLTGEKVERVVEVRAQFDHEKPFIPQVRALMNQFSTRAGDESREIEPAGIFILNGTPKDRASRSMDEGSIFIGDLDPCLGSDGLRSMI